MQAFPHHYQVRVHGTTENHLTTSADGLPNIEVAAPIEFDGPGNAWSPESLLMAAVANCFVLSFRAITKASHFDWLAIECESTGTLDKVERQIQFTAITTKAKLFISDERNKEKAEKLLLKAETACLISNSLACKVHLDYEILVTP